MREYLFRGKSVYADTQNTPGYWIEGGVVYIDLVHEHTTFTTCHVIKKDECLDVCFDDSNEIWPETVGQYTGYVDKNGNKIFEDDIVKTKNGRLCIVTWFQSNLQACWDLKSINTYANMDHEYPSAYDLWLKENLEVVGNIYDNPELLKN